MTHSTDALAQRLLSLQDSILRLPEAHRAPDDMCRLAEAVAHGTCDADLRPLVEPFDGGALIEILFIGGLDEHLVAIVGQSDALAVVVTGDQGEADSLYAGLAEQLGILNGKCEGCGAAIPSVYQYCITCV